MDQPRPPGRDEEAVRAFIENFSASLAARGVPRMSARVLMALMTAEAETLTAAEIGEALGASPAAISNALKYLVHVGLVRRESVPHSRRDRYRMSDDHWFSAAVLKADFMTDLADETDKAIVHLGGSGTIAGARMAEMSEFYHWVAAELPRLYDHWREYRATVSG